MAERQKIADEVDARLPGGGPAQANGVAHEPGARPRWVASQQAGRAAIERGIGRAPPRGAGGVDPAARAAAAARYVVDPDLSTGIQGSLL